MAEQTTKIKEEQEFEEIVRIMGKDMNGHKKLIHELRNITGVSFSFANAIISLANFDKNMKTGFLKENDIQKIEDIIKNPAKYNLPSWLYNRRKDFGSGKDIHLVEAEREVAQKFDIRRMKKMKSYKGLRHSWGLPVRGQRTKTSFRKGKRVGVSHKKK